MSSSVDASPPRAPPVKYATPLGTRWQKEKAAAGSNAFEYPDDAKYVGPWIIGECVGKGASGRVKIARHRRTGQLAAIKILPLQPFLSSRNSSNAQAKAEKQRLGIDREIIMMKLMNHPNIMRIYDVYEGEKELYLILEYVEGGELFDFLVNRGRLPPLEALAYFKQIVYGLNYAHTFSIIHRDLKPENILIHSLNPPLIKIADWGMAAFAPPTLQLETSCGSPHYASPEIVNGHKYCGTATDIWSCGVILYALLTGRLPFDDKNVRTLLTKVKAGKYDMPSFVDPLAKDLLCRMLVVDVNKRITMAEILAHPWLDGQTPGITYVPAPPVSELAKPLPSALHIDRDLFESLCVIWGRHADIESIRLDLLSPAGYGTLAKAFYFLLQKHREQAMEEHGILMDLDQVLNTAGKVITKQYAAPRSKPGRHSLDLARGAPAIPVSSLLRSDRPAPPPPSRTPSPKPRLAINTTVHVPTRPHPPSPIGPRPQKPRPQAARNSAAFTNRPSFVPNPDITRARSQTMGPSQVGQDLHHSRHMPPPMQRKTVNVESAAGQRPAVGSSTHGGSSTRASHYAVSHPGVIHAPVPLPAAPHPMLSAAHGSPMLTTPRCPDVDMEDHVQSYASSGNAQWSMSDGDRMLPSRISRPEHRPSVDGGRRNWSMPGHPQSGWFKPAGSENKENGLASVTRTSQPDSTCNSGGLGFGHSVPLSKEMGNVVFIHENGHGQQHYPGKKAGKGRPPPLDFHGGPVLHKRPTFSVGSPRPGSPPSSSMSPAVGEFKGWFSNLFHWKVQSIVLYSVLDLPTTRSETIRLLEYFGVSLAVEDRSGFSVLLCRMDDVHDGSVIVQKQVRFRVEFSSCSSASYPTPMHGTPRMGQMSFPGARSRADGLAAGYETVIGIALEKGSVTTFKNLCQRLRNEWRLDALVSPTAAATPGIQQQFMV
ncbi:Pkinase-domain-containing protein [Lentinus tigrinus ALCF2SS1-6]|uniref:Pkinase-domain-containing protein n=1 Tax=Lentinus tigrinus ALCF2SS1-6 TaxID=1328759 RepID=A0A5C2RYE8_9APHY|nr:Pkinase-domain-containing protein [Lentinus tigrinus ALCF2SS1-6]